MLLIPALRSGTKTLCLDNAGLESLPSTLSRFPCLISLSAKCNRIRQLPSDLSHLERVSCFSSSYYAFTTETKLYFRNIDQRRNM